MKIGVTQIILGKMSLDDTLALCKEAGYEATEYRVESRFPKPIKLKGG